MSCEEGEASSDSVDYGDVVDGHVMQNSLNIRHNGHYMNTNMMISRDGGPQPYLEIVEQPQSRGFRFRYQCEGSSHGGLRGEKNSRNQRTFPSVKIHNYRGPAKVTVTLVTDEKDPRPHAHELIGKNCKNGCCSLTLNGDDMTVVFQNLGIRHVTKKNVQAILTERILERIKISRLYSTDSMATNRNKNITEMERQQAREQAEEQARSMQLNVVRLCFTAYLMDAKGEFTRMLQPVFSSAIFDSKSPGTAALRIYRMDKCGGCCYGQEEVFLLCDKVQKDDIAVRFFECDEDGQDRWDAYGVFGPADVHRQFAIVFRTPPYRDCSIGSPVSVRVQLKRMSDGECSEPKDFTYYPKQHDEDEVHKKRKKPLPFGTNSCNTGFFPGGNGVYNGVPGQAFNTSSEYTIMGHVAPIDGRAHNMHPIVGQQFPGLPTYMEFQTSGGKAGQMRVVEIDGAESDDAGDSGSSSSSDSDSDSDSQSDSDDSSALEADVDDVDGMTDADLAARLKSLQVDASVTKTTAKKHGKKCKKLTELDESLAIKMSECRYRALHDYAKTGNIQHLLKGQHNLIGIVDNQGDTALHHSVIHTQPSVIDNLLRALERAPDRMELINQTNKLKQTPLHVAAITNQAYAIRALCSQGADPTLIDRNGNTPLHLAVLSGDMATLRALLIDRPAHAPELTIFNFEGYAPLHMAVLHGNLEVVQELLNSRADVNLPEGRSGRTALHLALEAGKEAMATHMLLEHSADINAQAFDGNTPLHIAVGRRLLHMVSFLISMGADQHAQNFQGEETEESSKEAESPTADKPESESRTADKAEENKKTGVTPRDLANNDDMLLRILDGEVCPSLLPGPNDVPLPPVSSEPSLETSFGGFADQSSATSSVKTKQGDLDLLNTSVRQQLASELDPITPGSDWIALATWMSMSSEFISEVKNEESPTLELLAKLQSEGNTIEQLKDSLKKMEHTSALRIIQQGLAASGSPTPASSRSPQKSEKLTSVQDSGVELSTTGSFDH